jgi:2-polyprenyl-6-methoxyphenol hydroxylase-like FAD-dependent oxidoreductase
MTDNAKPRDGIRVAVVGGSIAGCAVAVELARAGYTVSVFERARGQLVGQGAGIATRMATFRSLVARDLVDADLPYCHAPKSRFIVRGVTDDRYGQTVWARELDGVLMHWRDLYRALRRRVPTGSYHEGSTVVDARMVDRETVEVRFADGSEQRFDLVIFADGYRSLGRRLLFPNVHLEYCGYVAWRGLLDERHLAHTAPLESALGRVIYRRSPGHLVPYFVPGSGGSTNQGARTVNWAAYVAVPPEDLPRFLTDRQAYQHTHALPPGLMRLEEESRLKAWIQEQVPPYYAEIVTASRDTFAQPIYRVEPPAYRRGRICLIRDAGALAPPVTGSGVFRGTTNAIELATALQAGNDLDAALAAWDEAQTATGRRFAAWVRQLEQALIWATPDLASLDAAAVEEWYYRTAPIPPGGGFGERARGVGKNDSGDRIPGQVASEYGPRVCRD